MFTLFFSVQGSLFSFPPDLLACLFIYPWSVGELSVAQLWNYMSCSSPLARVHFPCSLLGQWTPLWWIFRKIETCWRGVFIKMFQDNWSISYKRDDSLGKCLVAAIKLAAEAVRAVAARSSNVEKQNWSRKISTTSLYLLMRSDQKSFVSIPEHYNSDNVTIWTLLITIWPLLIYQII